MSDVEYWNSFYKEARPAIQRPSTFALWCADKLGKAGRVFELGCGNGRDARFFASLGHKVIACDRSEVAIQELGRRIEGGDYRRNLALRVADMAQLPDMQDNGGLTAVYSRFTLHAVTAAQASAAMGWAFANLASDGCFYAEARSVKGSLYGKGEEVARDTYLFNSHTRRFVRREELEAELVGLGFEIRELIEADGLAVHRDDDPVVVRVVAAK